MADGALVKKTTGHRNAGFNLFLDQPEVAVRDETGRDAETGERLDLRLAVGGVAVAEHPAQVGVVTVRAGQRARLQRLEEISLSYLATVCFQRLRATTNVASSRISTPNRENKSPSPSYPSMFSIYISIL